MTLSNDIVLKSWLRTLRFSVEYYEDTFDAKNNRLRLENDRRAQNMIIDSETNEDGDEEPYVNIWECADSDKSASKLKNSLESVENTSEVSIFEGESGDSSFNTHSAIDLSVSEENPSFTRSVQDPSDGLCQITDLDEEPIKKKPRKPKVIPRISKGLGRVEVVYENLPLRTQRLSVFSENTQEQDIDLHHDYPDERQIYVNLPLPQRGTEQTDDSESTQIYENLPLRTQNYSDDSLIYESLPVVPENRKQSQDSLSDEWNFEERVCSTIQYLENVLDSVDTYSDFSDIEEEACHNNNNNPTGTFESDVSSVNLKIEENYSLLAQNIGEEKFTESSSSFGEYVPGERLSSGDYVHIEAQPQNLNQRFAKDNRVSVFFEEPEPVLPQEVKHIPATKNGVSVFDRQNRSSVSIPVDQRKKSLFVRRPQSLQSTGFDTVDLEEFESFKEYLKSEKTISSKTNGGDLKPQHFEENIDSSTGFVRSLVGKGISSSRTEDFDFPKEHIVPGEKIEESTTQNLNVSFAKESRISILFEEGIVKDLDISEGAPENIYFKEEAFLENLTGDVVVWMADLVGEYCVETMDIMEEKELLKSINQIPKERIERPPENKFPLDDENVEIRRRPSIPPHRMSKTTDFDLGRRKQDSPINPKNFDIRGIVKFQLPNNTIITKLNQEYVAYENENFYRINDKTKAKVPLAHNVSLKLVRYINSRSKESKEVELKDTQNCSYFLYFDSIKYAKQFMDNEKIQAYVSDNKVTIKKTLLRFLGKRSSREILEKKGIYKNEPIFGNTLRDINVKGAANFGSPVPVFIYRVIELIERPENIKSLGLYRTSGNLATIQKIRFEVDNGRLEILDQFSKDPDVLTGSLKLFFRELKEPLITCDVCEKLMEITRLDPKQMSSKDHQKIKSTLAKNLHEANLETFYVVMRHLLEVVKNKEHNKMDAYNLAVCWGPSMIFSVHGVNNYQNFELSKDIVTQSHDASRLVDFLLGYYQLFPWELDGLSKRPESVTEKILALKRQESRDSVESSDSSKSQKKSSSNLSLSIDEITKKLIEIIEPNLSTEGLYKKPGSPDKTNKIMKKLNKKKIHELDKYKTDVHEMTDALKRYLREQDGLVTKEIVESVLKATSDNSQNYMEPTTRRKVASLIEEAPKKDTLLYLLRHLGKVIDHQTRHRVSKNDIIAVWTDVLDHQRKCHVSYEEFGKFLTVAVEVFNDNLPDIVRSSFNNNGGTPNRNDIMGEVVKQMKHQQERDRNSRYDNVDCDVSGEASVLDEKTEQTKL